MTDETNVNAGSETSSETAETALAETVATESAQTETVDAGGTADESTVEGSETASDAVDATESRTGFVKGARPGEECTCPDGRKGTVHKFDEGLVCIPNADQG
jgi:hypothetical protein